ncbi:MAG: hypothetical protein K2M48_02915 [Clostridiales bacterium]|nr:hypothetical protein [Clostridiales bacterium]
MKKQKTETVEEVIDDNIPADQPASEGEASPAEVVANTESAENSEISENSANAEKPAHKKSARKKKELSGAYWYSVKEDADLLRNSQIRTLIHVIALMLQLVVLVLPQVGLEYVTKHVSSYAFVYMWAVFIMIGVSIYVIIMDCVRNKLKKRIPVERAPKKGFKRRAFLTAEIDIAINALLFVIELSFVCIAYDGFGLLGMFITAAATGMAIWARELERRTLKDAELIPAPDEQPEVSEDKTEETTEK